MMPDIDGYEAIPLIKNTSRANTYVVIRNCAMAGDRENV
jgi:CheY-like chemotaxis protein